MKRISNYKAEGTILDIGCSSGAFLSTMKGPSWKLYGIEMEESTAQKARAATGATVFVGDAVAAPFDPGMFEVITSFDLLEHVYDPPVADESLGMAKAREHLLLLVPNIDSWEARLFRSYWYGLELPRHISHFSPRSMRHLIGKIGYEEVLIKTPSVSYIERSIGYLSGSFQQTLGLSPAPQAKSSQPRGLMLYRAEGDEVALPVAPFLKTGSTSARVRAWKLY